MYNPLNMFNGDSIWIPTCLTNTEAKTCCTKTISLCSICDIIHNASKGYGVG